MRTENSLLIEEGGKNSTKEETKKKFLLSGCIGFIQSKSYHLMSMIPKVQWVILALMIIDLASLIMLCVTNTSDDSVHVWVIIFYIVSAISTVIGVIYLCATKPPKDIAKLMTGHKELLSQFTSLNLKHQKGLREQEELIQQQKEQNLKLQNEVDNFQGENTKLQDSVQSMKNSNEFLSKTSQEHVTGLAKQISFFKEENKLYEKLNQQLSSSKQRLKSVRNAMVSNVNAQSEVTKGLLNVNQQREEELDQREVADRNLQDAVREVELREEIKELPEPPTHISSDALPEPPTHEPTEG